MKQTNRPLRNLDKQVESGNLTLAAEKRALQDIITYKRNRRTVETFQADQESIEADRKQLDDPESKAISARFDAIKAELDEIKKQDDEAYAAKAKLFTEKDNIKEEINALYTAKRDSVTKFREANDRYYAKLNEDRARRAEKARAQRAAEESAKKLEVAERLREEASIPAFSTQIEDCQTLIDYFSGKNKGDSYATAPASLAPKTEVVGVEKLDIRKVDAEPQEGLVARKKKGEVEDNYFVGKGKKAKKSGGSKASTQAEPTASTQLNVPLPTLSALLSLSIPPPSATADVPRVVDNLKTKKAWFEANQSRVTAENIAKAETDVQKLTNGPSTDLILNKHPAEPAPTPQASDISVGGVNQLEDVQVVAN